MNLEGVGVILLGICAYTFLYIEMKEGDESEVDGIAWHKQLCFVSLDVSLLSSIHTCVYLRTFSSMPFLQSQIRSDAYQHVDIDTYHHILPLILNNTLSLIYIRRSHKIHKTQKNKTLNL